jgi:hypothetical protein
MTYLAIEVSTLKAVNLRAACELDLIPDANIEVMTGANVAI